MAKKSTNNLYDVCTWICIIIVVILIGMLFNNYFNNQKPVIRAEHFFSSPNSAVISNNMINMEPTSTYVGRSISTSIPLHMRPDGKKHMPRPADKEEYARHNASIKKYN